MKYLSHILNNTANEREREIKSEQTDFVVKRFPSVWIVDEALGSKFLAVKADSFIFSGLSSKDSLLLEDDEILDLLSDKSVDNVLATYESSELLGVGVFCVSFDNESSFCLI